VLVPWPIVTEVDLLLRSRGHSTASFVFARALLDGVHQFDAPTEPELELALDLGEQYADSGVDLTDLTVMAIAHSRNATILTWDFRHFRSVILERGHHWPLLVEEHELPAP